MKDENKIAVAYLSDKLMELGGKVFTDFILHNSENDEVKKNVQANDFLTGLYSGNLKTEWKLEDSQGYKDLLALSNVINKLIAE